MVMTTKNGDPNIPWGKHNPPLLIRRPLLQYPSFIRSHFTVSFLSLQHKRRHARATVRYGCAVAPESAIFHHVTASLPANSLDVAFAHHASMPHPLPPPPLDSSFSAPKPPSSILLLMTCGSPTFAGRCHKAPPLDICQPMSRTMCMTPHQSGPCSGPHPRRIHILL